MFAPLPASIGKILLKCKATSYKEAKEQIFRGRSKAVPFFILQEAKENKIKQELLNWRRPADYNTFRIVVIKKIKA